MKKFLCVVLFLFPVVSFGAGFYSDPVSPQYYPREVRFLIAETGYCGDDNRVLVYAPSGAYIDSLPCDELPQYWTPSSGVGFYHYVMVDGIVNADCFTIGMFPTYISIRAESCVVQDFVFNWTGDVDYSSVLTTNYLLGSLNLGISVLIVFASLGFIGYIYNRITPKKPWL